MHDSSTSKKSIKRQGFKYEWLSSFPWLRYDNINKLMYCKLCNSHSKKNDFATKGNINKILFIIIFFFGFITDNYFKFAGSSNISRISALKEHAKSDDHKDAINREREKEAMYKVSNNAIQKADNHVLGLMKTIYWMAKNDIPLYKFSNTINLGRSLNSPCFMESIS
jgi:hypothetical protein